MIEQLLILAESGSGAAEGIHPAYIGIGMFIVMLALLGITYLTSGANQPSSVEHDDDHDHDHGTR